MIMCSDINNILSWSLWNAQMALQWAALFKQHPLFVECRYIAQIPTVKAT